MPIDLVVHETHFRAAAENLENTLGAENSEKGAARELSQTAVGGK